MRRLLQKRWVATGGVPLRTHVGVVPVGLAASASAMSGSGAQGLLGLVAGAAGVGLNVGLPGAGGAGAGGGSGANSGTSTPFGSRSGVGATVFEEDEEDLLERGPASPLSANQSSTNSVPFGMGGGLQHDPAIMAMGAHMDSPTHTTGFESHMTSAAGLYDPTTGRMRTQTGSTIDTLSSSTSSMLGGHSTAYTTPDVSAMNMSMSGLGIGSLSPGPSGNGGTTSNGQTTPGQIVSANSTGAGGGGGSGTTTTTTNPTPLTPVVALPTGDGETQLGLAKVAEPDSDAFLTYAAIVTEYCRLEGMLVKGIV
jgi:xylulokinase